MYQKFHRMAYPALLSPFERMIFGWRGEVIAEFTTRIAVPLPTRHRWLIYTDDATNPPILRALLFHGNRPPLSFTPLARPAPLRHGLTFSERSV